MQLLIAALLLTSAMPFACARWTNPSKPVSSPEVLIPKPTPETDVLTRPEGWSLPKVSKKTLLRTASVTMKTAQGSNVDVTVAEYRTEEIVREPFASLGMSYGTIRLKSVRAYSTRRGTFAYLITASPEKKKMHDSEVMFSYAFVDSDGDGKFDRLLRRPIDQLESVPEWASR